jgi:hypothetical protein
MLLFGVVLAELTIAHLYIYEGSHQLEKTQTTSAFASAKYR